MDSLAENQISYTFCFSRTSLVCAAVVVPSLAFTCFLSPGISPLLLTLSVLVLSTASIATFIKRRVLIPNERSKQVIYAAESESSTELESITSEEVDSQSPATSDCSISDDEDSLIEIALPSQHSADSKEEPRQKPRSNLPDCLPESVLQRQDMEDLLSEIHEVNEEENLIEIDISIGSIIKCSRLELEA